MQPWKLTDDLHYSYYVFVKNRLKTHCSYIKDWDQYDKFTVIETHYCTDKLYFNGIKNIGEKNEYLDIKSLDLVLTTLLVKWV